MTKEEKIEKVEKQLKMIYKINKDYRDYARGLRLVMDYEKLINILHKTNQSVARQLKAIDTFFTRHPKININRLSQIVPVRYDGWSEKMEFETHPLLELVDVDNYTRKVTQARLNVVTALLKNHVSPDLSSTNFIEPLFVAVKTGDHALAKLLLKYGANPNCIGQEGIPILCTAAAKLDQEMVEILLAHEADINIKTTYRRSYPRLKNHNVLAYMFLSNNGETPDQVYDGRHDHQNAAKLRAMIKLLRRRGISLQARLGYKNKTITQLIAGLSADSLDAYGNDWGTALRPTPSPRQFTANQAR